MSYYENGPDIEERELPIHIEGPRWYITYYDVNAESAADVVVGKFQIRPQYGNSIGALTANDAVMLQLQEEGHDLHIRHGYAWKIDGEDYPGLGYFALSEDDAISDADTLLNEREFYAMADMIENQMDEERWARGQ